MLKKKVKKLFKFIGPGFITGSADDDPSGIATYTQAGATLGYTQLWTALFCIPFMIVVQEACGRIGLVTGKGLAGVILKHYSKTFLSGAVLLLVVANMINIGADLSAMANCLELLVHIPYVVSLIIITIVTLLLQVFISYRKYANYLKYLALTLFFYIITAFFIKQDWSQILKATLVPTIEWNKDYVLNIVAILGTTVSPYLFFWQTSQEVEEEVSKHTIKKMGNKPPPPSKKKINSMRIDTIVGMIFSCVIMWFIIITAASTLHVHHITAIQTADQAALALKPIAGEFAFALFSVAIISCGLLAVPTLSGSAAYAVADTFKMKQSLNKKFNQAPGFYYVIIFATIFGLLTNFLGIKPFTLLYYSAAINGVFSAPLLILIFFIANDKKIMKNHKSTLLSNILLWILIVFIFMASIALIYQLFTKH
jgi:NRAMP (natural resistance-associated macrophage protein)-like metal ion transporter